MTASRVMTLAVCSGLLSATVVEAAEIEWVHAYRDARKEAKAADKIMILDFYTDW